MTTSGSRAIDCVTLVKSIIQVSRLAVLLRSLRCVRRVQCLLAAPQPAFRIMLDELPTMQLARNRGLAEPRGGCYPKYRRGLADAPSDGRRPSSAPLAMRGVHLWTDRM